ncbi:MAG: glycoside hydrolase domain-containing protein, partial [Lentisphaeria bacterium]
KDYYRFAGSFAGGYTESKNNDVNYNPLWTYRTTNKMQVDDSVCWQGEVMIPWESIGFAAPPKDGVKFNFCRTWRLNDELIISALSRPGFGYDDYEGYTLLLPVTAVPSLQITAQNDPTYGNLEQKITVRGKAAFTALYQVTLENSQGMITPEVAFRKDLNLTPGEKIDFALNIPLTTSNIDSLVFTLGDPGGKKVYQQQVIPVKISPDYLSVFPLFGQEKVIVRYRKNQAEAKFGKGYKAQLVLVSPDSKDLYSHAANMETTVIPFVKDNRSGVYRIELRTAEDSRIISACSLPFTGFGEWSKLKCDNRIIPPFTPLEVNGKANRKTVSMWGRNYVLAENSLFPVQMMSQDQQLLANPAALRINGKEIAENAKTKWGKSEKHRFEYTTAAASQEWRINNSAWIEYDGVSFYQVEVEALQNLGTIELAFTLPRKAAKYLHAAAGPWGSKITDAVRNGKRTLLYYPVVFLGDEEKGFCFFAESRHTWPEKSSHVMEINANDITAEFTVTLASALKTGEKFTFEFGLLGTPVKKLPANYPLNTMGGYSELNRPGKTPTCYTAFTQWMNGQTHGDCLANLPEENNPLLNFYQKEVTRIRHYNAKPFPYAMNMSIPDEYPEVAAFLQEWGLVPLKPYPYMKNGKKYGVHTLCPTTAASDFYIWNTQQMLKHVKFDGLYFDYGTAQVCNNNLHGCYGRTAILGTREHMRRIALALMDSGVNDYVIVMHNTDYVQPPALTFVTHLFNGEHIRQASSSLLHDGKDILDTYPLAMFACELNTIPFGITNSGYMPADVLSPKYGGGKEKPELYVLRMTRAMLAGMLIHNSMPAMNRSHSGIFDKIVRIYQAFGVPQAKFYGYYNPENPALVMEGEEVYASSYRHANGRELLTVVSHIGNKRIDQTVK